MEEQTTKNKGMTCKMILYAWINHVNVKKTQNLDYKVIKINYSAT